MEFLPSEIYLGHVISLATVHAEVLGHPAASKTAIGSR
jgi:hypothetical protein